MHAIKEKVVDLLENIEKVIVDEGAKEAEKVDQALIDELVEAKGHLEAFREKVDARISARYSAESAPGTSPAGTAGDPGSSAPPVDEGAASPEESTGALPEDEEDEAPDPEPVDDEDNK